MLGMYVLSEAQLVLENVFAVWKLTNEPVDLQGHIN
jgi:hypothetical protein